MNRKNLHFLEGNLTRDPKVTRFLSVDKDGKDKENVVVDFTLACDGGRNGNEDETYFADCEVWDTAAVRVGEFRKGDCLYVEAVGRNKEWLDKSTGEKRFRNVYRVTHFIPVFVKGNNPL